MRHHEWRDLIVTAVKRDDKSALNSLAAHLADCETAFAILRAKHYRHDSIIDIAGAVPKATNGPGTND